MYDLLQQGSQQQMSLACCRLPGEGNLLPHSPLHPTSLQLPARSMLQGSEGLGMVLDVSC